MGFILNLKVQDVRVVNYVCDQRRGTILSLVHLVPMEGNNNKNLSNRCFNSIERANDHVHTSDVVQKAIEYYRAKKSDQVFAML